MDSEVNDPRTQLRWKAFALICALIAGISAAIATAIWTLLTVGCDADCADGPVVGLEAILYGSGAFLAWVFSAFALREAADARASWPWGWTLATTTLLWATLLTLPLLLD
jgi:hypothetical protein